MTFINFPAVEPSFSFSATCQVESHLKQYAGILELIRTRRAIEFQAEDYGSLQGLLLERKQKLLCSAEVMAEMPAERGIEYAAGNEPPDPKDKKTSTKKRQRALEFSEANQEMCSMPSERMLKRSLSQSASSLLGLSAFGDGQLLLAKVVADLPYQLLPAIAGTLLEAENRKATKAVFVVHEFRTRKTVDANLDANADALNRSSLTLSKTATSSLGSTPHSLFERGRT